MPGTCWKAAFVIAFAVDVPQQISVVYGKCDYIERNNFIDGDGRTQFIQLIGWSCRDDHRGFRVDWWRIENGKETWSRNGRGGWLLSFEANEKLIIITAAERYETTTAHDPELNDREWLPKEQRPGWSRYIERGR